MGPVERRQHRRQHAGNDTFRHMDADVTRYLALPAGDHIAHLVEAAQGGGDLLGQAFTLHGQANAPGPALDQRGAEEVLQLLDLPADCGGGHVQALRRLTQGGAPGHLVEVTQRS